MVHSIAVGVVAHMKKVKRDFRVLPLEVQKLVDTDMDKSNAVASETFETSGKIARRAQQLRKYLASMPASLQGPKEWQEVLLDLHVECLYQINHTVLGVSGLTRYLHHYRAQCAPSLSSQVLPNVKLGIEGQKEEEDRRSVLIQELCKHLEELVSEHRVKLSQ